MKNVENPKVRAVILLLGAGAILAGAILIPTLPMAAKPLIDFYKKKERQKDLKVWNRFNQPRLKQVLKRLQDQKEVEIFEKEGETVVRLTEKGKHKFLKYQLEEMIIEKPATWDGRWRVIIYDINKNKKTLSEVFRRMLKKLEFFRLQKSVYLTPYPCSKEIEFLKNYYGLSGEVLYLEVERLENEKAYKEYFAL